MLKQTMWKYALVFVLALGLAAPASAAEFGFFGFDVRAGLVVPSDWDTGFSIGASANVGELVDGLYLYPGVAYSQAEESETVFGTDFDLELTSLAVGAEVRYFPAQEQRGWYFGGGPYLHFLEAEVALFNRLAVGTADSEEIAITGVAGYQLGSGGSGLLVEARYSVVSGFDNGQILVGYSF